LSRVLGLGAAQGAVEHWWLQRLTAIALLPLGLWLCFGLLSLDDFSYASIVAWLQRPIASIMFIFTAVALAYHSHLGLQVVIEDYLHIRAMKLAALILSAVAHVGLGIAGVFAVLKVAFGP
jgi:succinate dehydrogenase / fumarate reductase membrane anchor subunit